MKARLRRKLEKLGRLPKKKVPKWKDYFPFERMLIEYYQIVKSTEPSDTLLLEGKVNTNGHFEFSSERWNILPGDGKYFKFDPVPTANQDYDGVKRYIIKLMIEANKINKNSSYLPWADKEIKSIREEGEK